MIRHPKKLLFIAVAFAILTGCSPTQPFYLRDSSDLTYYLDQQVDTTYPDVDQASLDEVVGAHEPYTLDTQNITNFWDLTLEDCVSIALQNSKVIRGYGTPGLQGAIVTPGIDNLANGPQGAGTIYDVAVRETEPGFLTVPGQQQSASALATNTGLDSNIGVEAALAEFDASLTSSTFVSNTDRPQNFVIPGLDARRFTDYNINHITELSKKTAEGTQLFFRNVTDYRRNNNPLALPGPDGILGTADDVGGAQALSSTWTTAFEMEARQPLMRGRGAFINRMPVIISRIGTDQQLASLEAQLHNMVANVEIRYWDLHCAYRGFEAAREARDSALEVYNLEKNKYEIGSSERGRGGTKQSVAQAQGQYFNFRAQAEQRYARLLESERDLRYLMRIASTDGRFIRPADEPISTQVTFDYCTVVDESLSYRPLLRQQRWELKKRQLAVAYAKNGLLPQLDAVGLYRWVGLGDDLLGGTSRSGLNFPNAGSSAWEELTEGDYQEYRFGFSFGMPIGYRRELANVRNAQLKVAREVARLEDMELDIVRNLQHTISALKENYRVAISKYNEWTSAETEVNSFEDLRETGQATIDLALGAQRTRAEAKVQYYERICEYNKAIALLHLRKGTILEHCGISFGEGPWVGKAYSDAEQHAQRRSASREINYGYTRPGVVSLSTEGNLGHTATMNYGHVDSGEIIVDESYAPTGEVIVNGPIIESAPMAPTNAIPQPAIPQPGIPAPMEMAPPSDIITPGPLSNSSVSPKLKPTPATTRIRPKTVPQKILPIQKHSAAVGSGTLKSRVRLVSGTASSGSKVQRIGTGASSSNKSNSKTTLIKAKRTTATLRQIKDEYYNK